MLGKQVSKRVRVVVRKESWSQMGWLRKEFGGWKEKRGREKRGSLKRAKSG